MAHTHENEAQKADELCKRANAADNGTEMEANKPSEHDVEEGSAQSGNEEEVAKNAKQNKTKTKTKTSVKHQKEKSGSSSEED